MKQIHKEYGWPFLLEPTKLTRLVEKLHERVAEHQQVAIQDHFEVFLSGNRREEMTNVDDVLALENTRKRKIERLLIICSASTSATARADQEIQIDFAAPKSSQIGSARVVAVTVRSDDARWANRALSEIEEQIERTRLPNAQPVLVLGGLLVLATVLFFLQFGTITYVENLPMTMWLRGTDLDHVEGILNENRMVTESELREITTRQLRNVLKAPRPDRAPNKERTQQVTRAAIALGIVLVCGVYMLLTCYPSAVFLWGDEVDRRAWIDTKRKALWTVVLGVLVTGILSRLIWGGI